MRSIILVGGGGHCRSCIDVIESKGDYRILGIVQPHADGNQSVLGYPILGTDEDLSNLLNKTPYALIGVGQIKSPEARIHLFGLLKNLGAHLPVIKASTSYCSEHAEIGESSVLMHGSVVNAGARVGKNCIVNTLSLIEHDALIGNHSHVSTGARVNGAAKIGSGCFIGSGAVIKEGVTIGDLSIIGAGQIVFKDVAAGTILRGGCYA